MLKIDQKYTDFDDVDQVETLWFNISKTDFASDLKIIDRVQAMEDMLRGPERQLTTEEKQSMLDLVVDIAKMGYGVRSEDGKRFYKGEGHWLDFKASPVYEAFLWELFTDLEKAYAFMIGVMPKEGRAAAEAAVKEALPEVAVSVPPSKPAKVEENDNRPQWLIEGRAPSEKELRESPREYMMDAFRLMEESKKANSV